MDVQMESKPSIVTKMPSRTHRETSAKPLTSTISTVTSRTKKTRLGNTVVKGMALLIKGQRQFADEFGLSNARVFPQSHHLLDGENPEKCIKQIFRSGESGIKQLQDLFNDMIDHQLALFSAIDAVAKEALNSVSPNQIQNENPRRFTTHGGKWRFYKSYHKEFQLNDNIRFNMIVAPGFVKKYSITREKQK